MKRILIEELKKQLPNTFKSCKGGINKFYLMLPNVVYPDEYIGKNLMKHH